MTITYGTTAMWGGTIKPDGRRILGGLLVLLVALGLAATSARAAAVLGVRIGLHPGSTRVVVDLDAHVTYGVSMAPNGHQVLVDLPRVDWRLPEGGTPTGGMVGAFLATHLGNGQSRLIIEALEPVRVAQAFLLPADGRGRHRLVLDLAPAGNAGASAPPPMPVNAVRPAMTPTAPAPVQTASRLPVPGVAPAPAARPAVLLRVPPPLPVPRPAPPVTRRVIVIDPGHGGRDPGAIAPSGLYEKQITMTAARILAEALAATGRYDPVLTRTRDVKIPLRDRVRFARDREADMFISLHADAHHDDTLRGLSLYTLSETASDREAAALAEKENKADIIAGFDLTTQDRDVTNILIDLAQRETMNASRRLAQKVVREMHGDVGLLNKTHRSAGFAVLTAPDMPSILVELGYLSNPEDEKLLRDPAYLRKVAAELTGAIDSYFAGDGH